MSSEEDISTRATQKRSAATHTPPVPSAARWALRIGGALALACGAILSFYALFGLAVLNGWPRYIAWALPGSVDILTATACVVAMAVHRSHPGAKTAHWCAGGSLVMTVACNIEYHALLPAVWSIGHDFLVATGAVPAIVVELILIMQMRLGDGAALAAADNVTGVEIPSIDNPDLEDETDNGNEIRQSVIEEELPIGNPSGNGNLPPRQEGPGNPANGNPRERQKPAVKQAPAGQPSTDTWVWIGKPVYDELRADLGKRPGETVFHGALSARVDELIAAGALVGENKDEKPDVYADPSLSTAKRIRKEIEDRFPGIIFGQHADDEPEAVTEEEAA